jgi:hypothetical protein
VGDGETIRFWEDTWLGESPLAIQYPSLYNIVQRKMCWSPRYWSKPLLILLLEEHLTSINIIFGYTYVSVLCLFNYLMNRTSFLGV